MGRGRGRWQIKSLPTEELLFNVVGLDWARLAEMHVPTRSAEDCRIQWIGSDHPIIFHTDFSPCASSPGRPGRRPRC